MMCYAALCCAALCCAMASRYVKMTEWAKK